MDSQFQIVFAILLLSLISCGGGGSNVGAPDTPSNTPNDEVVSPKVFSVSLSNIEAERVSTGDKVFIDVSGVNSGELTLTE